MSLEALQEVIETSRQEDESESPEEVNAEPKNASDYLDLILQKNTKLSGIIDCIRGFKGEEAGEDLGNLGWAMHDFTDAIGQLVNDLWDHLRNIGALKIEEAAKSTEE